MDLVTDEHGRVIIATNTDETEHVEKLKPLIDAGLYAPAARLSDLDRDRLIYGASFVTERGERIDPARVTPDDA